MLRRDLTGCTFSDLTIVSLAYIDAKSRFSYWNARCSCGVLLVVRGSQVTRGSTKSCGHTRSRHGYTKVKRIPEYAVWWGIKSRCLNPRVEGYVNYGGRGISICERWNQSFADFMSDMGPRPSPTYSIERINNDGNYEPGNCKWATKEEQSANKRPWGSNRTQLVNRMEPA